MAAPNRLEEIARERGITVEALVTNAIEQSGSVAGASRDINVNVNTIRNWLKNNARTVSTRQVAVVIPINSVTANPKTP